MKKKKKWETISPNMFICGRGKQYPLANTKLIRVFKQIFSYHAWVKSHDHISEWEIVLGGPKLFSIYPPGKKHELKWLGKHSRRSRSILSIKIGKKPWASSLLLYNKKMSWISIIESISDNLNLTVFILLQFFLLLLSLLSIYFSLSYHLKSPLLTYLLVHFEWFF